jgi:hypothetical protein
MSKERRMRWRPSVDWFWFLSWGLVSSWWCLGAAAQVGPTFDEPLYVARGLEGWRTQSHHGLLVLGTMPLPIDVQTLPLYLWERWTGVVLDPVGDLPHLLFWARAATLVFWWLLLLYARLAGRELGGPWAGRLAVALLACEPNLLAHAALATTDIAVTACMLALLYHFRRGRDSGWRWRCGVPALWFGLALLAKASALVYGPICLVVIELERLARAGAFACPPGTSWRERCRHGWQQFRPAIKDLWTIGCAGLAVMFVYCGCDWQPEPSFVRWAKGLPDGALATCMTWLAEHLCIFSNAAEGLVRQIKHNMHGHGTYLLGQSHARALWYYFPVLLTIKLSVPLLLAPLAVGGVRARALVNWACLAAAVLLLCSLNFRVQIGIRLVLPLVALAVVGLAAALVEAWRQCPGTRRHLLAAGVTAALLWNVGAAVYVWPHGLCYVNELWGGTDHGYRLVSDSNYDWGQGLLELAAWQRQHGGADVDLWYFGSDPLADTLAMRPVPLHALEVRGPLDVVTHTHARYLAVSMTMLYGQATNQLSHQNAAAFLRSCPAAARTTTFVIFERAALRQRALAP